MLRITKAHREKQIAYNEKHGIVPKSVKRAINESAYVFAAGSAAAGPDVGRGTRDGIPVADILAELERDMLEAADNLEFERAAYLRDQIREIKRKRGKR